MPNYRRAFSTGGTCFFTVNLLERKHNALSDKIVQVSEPDFRENLRVERELHWRQENAEFISVYNQILEQEGLPLAEWRLF